MQLSEIRISLCDIGAGGRLKAFCSLTFDDTFVIRDVKLIEGNDGLFLAMPSRKLCDRCRRCGEKNHLRARFCNNCGSKLNESRYLQYQSHNCANGGPARLKLHADIAHPINAECRVAIERQVLDAYEEELQRSKEPGYIPHRMDDLADLFEDHEPSHAMNNPGINGHHLRPTGTAAH